MKNGVLSLGLFCFSGLVTLDEMKAKQEDVIKEREKQLAMKEKAQRLEIEKKEEKKKKKRDKQVN